MLKKISIAVVTFGFFAMTALNSDEIGEKLLFTSVMNDEVYTLVNEAREANGLQQLAVNEELQQAAQLKAENMANQGYFAHTSPDGRPFWYWIAKIGYDFLYSGENLAARFATSEGVVNAWLNSPTHKANIMDGRYSETGIGIATGMFGGIETEFVVQFFGKEMPTLENLK